MGYSLRQMLGINFQRWLLPYDIESKQLKELYLFNSFLERTNKHWNPSFNYGQDNRFEEVLAFNKIVKKVATDMEKKREEMWG